MLVCEAYQRSSIFGSVELDHVEVVVEDSSHAMKKNAFAQLDLRATRQPQALNRHGRRAALFSTLTIADLLKKGGNWKKNSCTFLKVFYELCAAGVVVASFYRLTSRLFSELGLG